MDFFVSSSNDAVVSTVFAAAVAASSFRFLECRFLLPLSSLRLVVVVVVFWR